MTKTCIVIGDSILSSVPQGTSINLALNLVSSERDVIFKSLAAPGNALGVSGPTGFNDESLITTFDRIGGYFSAWDYIMVMAGTNDFGRSVPWGDMVYSLRRIMNYAAVFNRKVIVFDPIWRAGEETPNSIGLDLNAYRFFESVVCSEFPAIAAFAHRENCLLGTSAGSAHYDAAEVAAGTQTHPNVAGHRLLADWIKAEAATAGLF